MRKRRQGLTDKNVRPVVSPSVLDPDDFVSPVSPKTKMLDPDLVRPESNPLNSVSPDIIVRPSKLDPVSPEKVIPNIKPCPLNHYSFKELFKQVTEQVRKDFQTIYSQYPETARKCFDCHNRERNYQIMLNLLNSYERKCKA